MSGTGRSSVTPDRFSFNVGVQTVGNTVDDAVSQNNKRVAAVLAALKAAGAQEKDIQTSNFNIYPQQNYQEGKPPQILGYQVTNSVTVRSTKVADAGKLLGVAIAAGVNTSSGINFEVADPSRGRDQGLRAAFDDAKAKGHGAGEGGRPNPRTRAHRQRRDLLPRRLSRIRCSAWPWRLARTCRSNRGRRSRRTRCR